MRVGRFNASWPLLLIGACLCLLPACASRTAVHPELVVSGEQQNVLALSDALEALIASGQDTPADREYAYRIVSAHEGIERGALTPLGGCDQVVIAVVGAKTGHRVPHL